MRHTLLVTLLVMSLAAPGFASATAALPLSSTVNSSTGVVSGTSTIGGVQGTITSSGGTWSMTVDGVTFASGTYTCGGGGCTYTGTVVGSPTTFSFTTNKTLGTITNATGFTTHGRWVSTVAKWANTHLAGRQIGDVVSSAAKIEGPLADPVHSSPNNSGDHGSGGHGGGHGR